MTEPKPTPQGKRKRRHGREGPNSWQNGRQESEKNRGPVSSDPLTQAKREREYYDPANHPKNASGMNICGAWKRHEKIECQRPAGWNTDHAGWGKCSLHGGNTPTLRTSAGKWVGGEIIHRMTTAYGYGAPADVTPVDALLGEVQRGAGHVAWLGERIGIMELFEPGEDGKPKVLTPSQHELIDLYHKERQQLVKTAKMALDAGVNERRVRLAEMQGTLMLQAINTVLDGLQLTVDQRRLVPTIVPAALRNLIDPSPARIVEGAPKSP